MTLIHKDLNGGSDLPGTQALHGMEDVGSEFMSFNDGENRVQKSGQFVTMTRAGGSWLRLMTVCEMANNRTTDGVQLDGDTPPEPGDENFVPRTFVLKSETSAQGDEGPLERRAVPLWHSRLFRYTLIEEREADVDAATKAGRRRLWALGNGNVLRTRETGSMSDGRYFYGSRGVGQPARRERVVKVELVQSSPDTLSEGEVLMEIFPVDGLNFEVGSRAMLTDNVGRGTSDYDDNYVFTDRVGHHFGRLSFGANGDPSVNYSVALPAMVTGAEPGARPYLHLAVVYARQDDMASPAVSTPRRLTCSYLDADGDTRHSTIEFAPYPVPAGRYPGISQYSLHRLAPMHLLLVTTTTPLIEPGGPYLLGTVYEGPSARLHWSTDGGETWTETAQSAWSGTPPSIRDGKVSLQTVVPLGAGRALAFSAYARTDDIPLPDASGVMVVLLTPDAVTTANIIPGSVLSQNLLYPIRLDDKDNYANYVAATETGGTCGKLAWAQFDPAWMQRENYIYGIPVDAGGLGHPFERPSILVTEDDGDTFERRLLPDPVGSRVGFVMALDAKTLAVPVFKPRVRSDGGGISALTGTVYTSRNGGRTWRANGGRFTLPYYCRADGQLFPDQYVDDYGPRAFNRGELFPLVALADEYETAQGASPGRPWMTDSRIKEPTP